MLASGSDPSSIYVAHVSRRLQPYDTIVPRMSPQFHSQADPLTEPKDIFNIFHLFLTFLLFTLFVPSFDKVTHQD